jgi:hypothetical protein
MTIETLFEGQELSEETVTKAKAIIEATIDERVEAKEKEIQESYDKKIEEEIARLQKVSDEYIQEHIIENIDKYVEIAITEWKEENQVAIEEGCKVEIAESFLKGLVSLAESHNLEIPKADFDKVKVLESKIEELKSNIIEAKEKNLAVTKEISEMKKEVILSKVTEKLTETQKEKLTPVIEKIDYKNDEQYETAVKSLIESYHPSKDDKDTKINEGKSKVITEVKDKYLDGLFGKLNA